MSAAIDFERLYKTKTKKIMAIMKDMNITDLQKRILTYFVLKYERGDIIDIPQQHIVDELHLSTISAASMALKALDQAGYIKKMGDIGKPKTYRLLF